MYAVLSLPRPTNTTSSSATTHISSRASSRFISEPPWVNFRHNSDSGDTTGPDCGGSRNILWSVGGVKRPVKTLPQSAHPLARRVPSRFGTPPLIFLLIFLDRPFRNPSSSPYISRIQGLLAPITPFFTIFCPGIAGAGANDARAPAASGSRHHGLAKKPPAREEPRGGQNGRAALGWTDETSVPTRVGVGLEFRRSIYLLENNCCRNSLSAINFLASGKNGSSASHCFLKPGLSFLARANSASAAGLSPAA